MNQTADKILVAGSANMDLVIRTPNFPGPGETVLGSQFMVNPGGKGANQAVAAAKMGGAVIFLARLGQDAFGDQMLNGLKQDGIETRFIIRDDTEPTGTALITVNDDGENTIVVAPGANARLSPGDADSLEQEWDTIGLILMQMETPVETIRHLAARGQAGGKTVILNPAPAQRLDAEILKNLSLITPNESEAELLTGIRIKDKESAFRAAEKLIRLGPSTVIITLGKEGALYLSRGNRGVIPTLHVKAVDTTAAGDTFNGALAVMLAEGKPIAEAIEFANRAAALSVQKAGAQQSIPYRKDVT